MFDPPTGPGRQGGARDRGETTAISVVVYTVLDPLTQYLASRKFRHSFQQWLASVVCCVSLCRLLRPLSSSRRLGALDLAVRPGRQGGASGREREAAISEVVIQ